MNEKNTVTLPSINPKEEALEDEFIQMDADPKLHTSMHIVQGFFPDQNYVNIRYTVINQGEWKLVKGRSTGITHCACISNNSEMLFFNYLTDFTLSSTCLLSFPVIIFTVYGIDFLGRSIIIGYGQTPVSLIDGVKKKKIGIFRPKNHNLIGEIIGKLRGTPAEFVNPVDMLVNNRGREFVRTESVGELEVEFETSRSDWENNGFI